MHDVEDDSPSVGVELLTDIKTILDTKQATKMFSAALLDELMADDEAPWPTWNRGKPMTARQLSTKLGEFGIKSKDIRIGTTNKKGYDRADFTEVFDRYLSSAPPAVSATTRQPAKHVASSDISSATNTHSVADEKTAQATEYKGCHAVADKNTPLPEEGEAEVGEDEVAI